MKISMLLLLLLLLSAPCYARVAGEYDILTQEWVWEASDEYNITDWLGIGYSLRCLCPCTTWKTVIPSWVPFRQDYEVWAEVRYKSVTVRLTDWCNHWLSQSGRDDDTHGLRLRVEWTW